jgi:hypothetical protein
LDDGGTLNGGVDIDPTPNTLTFNISNCGEHPIAQSSTVTTLEDTPYTFGLADFPLNDGNDQLLDLRVTALPTVGLLQLNNAAVAVGQFVSAADLASGKLRYVPPADANGLSVTSFSIQLDHSGTFCTPAGLDPTPSTIAINVTPVNDPPSGTDNTVTTNEDSPYTFSAADFGFSDPDDSPSNTLLGIKITAIPWDGLLVVTGPTPRVVGSGQFVAAGELSNLQYIPFANLNGLPLTGIYFEVQDSGGTANGGLDLDPTPNTITINITPVNDPPSFTSGPNQSVLDTDGLKAVAGWAKDISSGPANEASQRVHFLVKDDNSALFANQPAVDATGKLTFQPALGASGVANVTIVAVDDGGTANGGFDTSEPQTFTISVSLAEPLHNPAIAADVSGDGHVVAADALDVINFINAFGSGPVPPAKPGDPHPALYYDVTGDNHIAADDVVAIINYINAHPIVNQEATELALGSSAAETTDSDALYLMLATDSAQHAKRQKV